MTHMSPDGGYRRRKQAERARQSAAGRRMAEAQAAKPKPERPLPKIEIVSVSADGRGVVARVQSGSDPARSYTLHGSRGEDYVVVTCNCQGSGSPNGCYHMRAFKAVLEEGAFLP